MHSLTSSALFGIIITLTAYEISIFINKKFKSSILSPLLVSIIIVAAVLKIFKIPLDNYNNGGNVVSLFLSPATAILSISIYKQISILKKNFLPIIIGTAVGSGFSIISIVTLAKFFKLDEKLINSMIPKSVTTPIAMEISSQLGGIVPVTVACVVITGILGAIFSPILIKIFKINNSIAAGIAIGTSSHAIGTTKALEIGETEGAMSGLAIGIAGIITVAYSLMIN